MADNEYKQLRFDISEKVRLHPHQPGMDTLLELDLYPDVEIEEQDTHLKIHGYLRLNGAYRSNDQATSAQMQAEVNEEKQEEIAYVIPVEISLPTDKADLELLAAEVEAFDYQVLSPFELQIEALLTIDGLIDDGNQAPATREEAPEASFAGARAQEDEGREELTTSQTEEAEEADSVSAESDLPRSEAQELMMATSQLDSQERDVPDSYEFRAEQDHEYDKKDTERLEEEEREIRASHLEKKRQRLTPSDIADYGEEEFESSTELIGNKYERSNVHPIRPEIEEVSLSSVSADSSAEESSSTTTEVAAEARAGTRAEKSSGTSLEWARRLVREEEPSFVRMRMVIAQKNDSVDTIADRYNLASSRIMKLNSLDSHALEEGQIVYIPREA
ncbi:LysM peptidoglycan-binding domain-containing protein [Mechercharimyces sp. CAU 1602]|uniref:LysM peptidoglycan-binding domain-containing protein n=1 Tax=Mechercharimyces sp. CAU 1602 TaxID=2973933 RepID=UPI0021615EE4|nr:LysM peptidoglycan-binding domain-containing protein [Mechercharimyces sp. CAU 1602]MCS1351454.1 LysM peptidoglycan-binding domain-containing protein [Mechercharimyces sp. CAU 1602]